MLTLFHANPAWIDGDGLLVVDRKFLSGLTHSAAALDTPLTTVHPRLLPGEQIMDPVRVRLDSLPFRTEIVDTDAVWRPAAHEAPRLRALVAGSALVCHGFFDVGDLCTEAGVPAVVVAEFDLGTTLASATADAPSPVVKLVRGARELRRHWNRTQSIRRAVAVHCNGFPVYAEVARLNPHRLLYLDSRMGDADVIDETRLRRRLVARDPSRLRLVHSGRYEAMKGALDVVRVGLAALAAGIDLELHLYGQGRQAPALRALAAESRGRIVVHDAVPYPELLAVSRGFDAFVSCHVQSDPSCTYLEAFGCGLPIVGYANRMWRELSRTAQCGFAVPMRRIDAMVEALRTWRDDPQRLARDAFAARRFAAAHSFEKEFGRRLDDLRRLLAAPAPPHAQAA